MICLIFLGIELILQDTLILQNEIKEGKASREKDQETEMVGIKRGIDLMKDKGLKKLRGSEIDPETSHKKEEKVEAQ